MKPNKSGGSQMKKNIGSLFLCLIFVSAFADTPAPVVDHSLEVASGPGRAFTIPSPAEHRSIYRAPNRAGLGDAERINRLERQIDNLNEQNLLNKIEELQETIRKLNGKIEVQEYQIERLTEQVKDFYVDLDMRLEKTEPTSQQVADDTVRVKAPRQVTNGTTRVIKGDGVVPATASGIAGVFSGGIKKDIKKEVKKDKKKVVKKATKKDEKIDKDSLKPEKKVSKEDLLREQQMYQAAIDLLPEKKDESKSKLRAYLKKYPKGAYLSDVHYWLGEINFLQKNFSAAEKEFKIVVDKYSGSRRISNAMLKLALVHQNQGKKEQAKKELNRVIKRYPDTSAAQLAKQQLSAMD